MRKLLFFGLSQRSRSEVSNAANLARQLPRSRFRSGFLAIPAAADFLRDLGIAAMPLGGCSPEENLAATDRIVRAFQPDYLIAADALTLQASTGWSGLSLSRLRERYGIPLACLDQYDWSAAGEVADGYGGARLELPGLLQECDLLIRCCPLHRPVAGAAGVAVVGMTGGGLRDGGIPSAQPDLGGARPSGVPTVFLTAPPELDPADDPDGAHPGGAHPDSPAPPALAALAELVAAVPRIIHSHLAALNRPLRVVQVGGRAWSQPVADHIEYRHFSKLPHQMYHDWLASASLHVSTSVASVTLAEAVLAGVPALVVQNAEPIDLAALAAAGAAPAWLTEAAPQLRVAWPFRALPQGWYELLTPILRDNPYPDCFVTAGLFDRDAVLAALTALLDDTSARAALAQRQREYHDSLRALPAPADIFSAMAVRA